jgi:hypothetical protein
MMELNAHPMRLDLDDVACAAAKNYGIPIVISTDAHSTNELSVVRYGVLQARRGGLTKEDVANTRTWPQMKKLLGGGGGRVAGGGGVATRRGGEEEKGKRREGKTGRRGEGEKRKKGTVE